MATNNDNFIYCRGSTSNIKVILQLINIYILHFLVGTMNVIDCLAIAPYYLTLFFFPHPEMGPVDGDIITPAPGLVEEEEEEGGGFGNVGRIMQVCHK